MTGSLLLYTIYHQPETWPPFRVRAFTATSGQVTPGAVMGAAASLGLARLIVPSSADVPFARNHDDAPEIVETWM